MSKLLVVSVSVLVGRSSVVSYILVGIEQQLDR